MKAARRVTWAAAGVAAVAAVPVLARARQAKQAAVAARSRVERHLDAFSDLDLDIFSQRRWAAFQRTYAEDIVVHWPDGEVTRGLDHHLAALRRLFTYAPDTRIVLNPVKFGQGDWTAVFGEMQGTFTRPMTTPDGRTIDPTGRAFSLPVATIARWKGGRMVEEFLFWDYQTYFRQMGIEE